MPPIIIAIVAAVVLVGDAVALSRGVNPLAVLLLGPISLALPASKKPKQSSVASFASQASSRLVSNHSNIEPRKVVYGQVRVSGTIAYLDTANDSKGNKNTFLYIALLLAGHECDSVVKYYMDEDEVTLDSNGYVTTAKYLAKKNSSVDPLAGKSRCRITFHSGSPTQTVDTKWQAEIPKWDATHKLQNICYLAIRMEHDDNVYPNGVPAFSVELKGKKVYDLRTGITAYSNNPALCILDYVTSSQNDANNTYGLEALSNEVDTDSFIACANACDESVQMISGAYQKRYDCNGVIDVSSNPADILHDLISSTGGAVFYAQGKFWCFAGVYTPPVASVDETWLAGDIVVTPRVAKAQLFNAVRGTFVDPTQKWQPSDFTHVTNSFYESEDNGDQIFTDIALPFTTNMERAQRLAKLQLDKARQPITIEIPCNWKALQLMPYDNIQVSLDALGWITKEFRITEWDLNDMGGFTIVCQEESAASYDWDRGMATLFDAAPDTNLPSVNFMDVPGNPVITESIYETTDGKGVGVKAFISWAAAPNSLATTYNVEYQGPHDTDFIFLENTSNNYSTAYDLSAGTYNFRINAQSWRQTTSEWVTVSQEIIGLTIPPANITNFALTTVHNQAHLTWDQSPDLAVKIGGSIEIRYSPKITGATWNNGTALGPDLAGIATNATLPLKTGTYMIKAKSFNGLISNAMSSVVTTEANLFVLSEILTQVESPTFLGTKTNLYINSDDDTLGFVPTGDFDSEMGNFDDKIGLFDTGDGTYVSSGEYIFSSYQDLGATYTTRVNGTLDFLIYDSVNLFDGASGLFDSRDGLFDGADVGKITGVWYIKTTNSDPTGSVPTDGIWSDWTAFPGGIGDINARAYWLKIVFTNLDTSITFKATTISASTQVGTRQESFTNNSIISSGATLTYSRPFFGQPAIRYDIQSAADGDQMVITHITSGGKYTGLQAQVRNAGSGVTRTCNIFVDGF